MVRKKKTIKANNCTTEIQEAKRLHSWNVDDPNDHTGQFSTAFFTTKRFQ